MDKHTEIQPVPLNLTPLEYGVVVALAGIGLAAMTNNRELAEQYRTIIARPETAEIAFPAFERLVQALDAMSQEAV